MYPFINGSQQLRLDGPAMGDYGGNWRYGAATDGRRAGSTPTKRTRRDYEDGLPRTGYGAGRDRDVGYPRDRVYEDQMGRAGWRDGDGLGGGGDMMGYGGGLGGNELGMGPGLGPLVGGGGLGPLGMGGLPDESQLMGGRMGPLDVGMGGRPGALGLNGGAPEPDVLRGGLDVLPPDASSTLFVDGLPEDCSRREAAHIFRPFIGFKEVRLVHKDAKRADGGKVVLCFVEFADARCAATALEALQGYKFDETDHESYALRLTFARHPGPRGPARDDPYRGGGGRDRGDDYNNRSRGGGGGRR
ncbi:uncharacterized protein [Physcomitrium patens]|uniref:RRM domain-containing protein n=1 Tax=Physcomitrium patens TaxID=3218 RepID=A0A2K1KHK8_PHYPA|nr:nuclear speckle RNA-binding protein A-like [Physcomitrium patens]XP_024378595.1 nuclear speckle RNA-binding protein A-like [Physcomitrium patens]XP_024378596.1 nuclear speckle RNA-binding protein A-like [Physcomitrium patens]PNR53271.1 hypothetical protein PHYPA_009647 [Physcomitrium patens]|eukprot:XP_024378594.1 nuclear speckle RNA-binding protein A-like [Physcomitrella patens]